MKNIFLALPVLFTLSSYAASCKDSLKEIRKYLTYEKTVEPFEFSMDSSMDIPEPVGSFYKKFSCVPSVVSHLSLINFSCLQDKAYARDAVRLFARDITKELEDLNSTVDRALDLRIAAIDLANEIEQMILVDIGQGVLNQERKQFYMNQLMTFEQKSFSCGRAFGNQIGGMIANGHLLGRFTPHLDGEESLVAEVFGFESVEELVQLKDYMQNYSRDLRDAPVEIEMAQKELGIASKRFFEIFNQYLK